MKKGIIFIIFIVFAVFGVQVHTVQSEETVQTIPDEAIRLRILANSDTDEDQRIKHIVRDEVNAYITEVVQHIDDIEEGRRVIREEIPQIEKIVAQTLARENSEETFTVVYRSDVSFPTKVYDQYIYPAGEYEAVLISIGEGKGANWWCVLFPPLCFLDFSNGTTVAAEEINDEHEATSGQISESVEKDEQMSETAHIETETTEKVDEMIEETNEPIEETTEETEEILEKEEVKVKFFLLEWLGIS